ncbi:hypothetical protein BDB00DRAFT_383885 [Zychaea mexicana]|uniref:uncharacterized protein n=1 Tax=Zychaea mexicana TaxID=64656 RepID=UPI0022FE2322|nr:uncharacterized protein BDB00DRAFT_383885 [Zychaea mexicana]KAI9493089.1 hypothetical protein BDB00DRAFT_383885 [Zychaea mexicana]
MEFPDLGKHCTFEGCSQLDFLPYTCYQCKKIFCQEHFKLDEHRCPSLNDPQLDVRVPTCPICESPVPGPRNEDPNIRVNRHIQNNCADTKKPSNVCRQKGCKAKLLVPMQCSDCGKAYCVKHRLPVDHECKKENRYTSVYKSKQPAASTSPGTKSKASISGLKGLMSSKSSGNPSTSKPDRPRPARAQQNAQQRKQEMARLREKARNGVRAL